VVNHAFDIPSFIVLELLSVTQQASGLSAIPQDLREKSSFIGAGQTASV